MDRSSAFPRSVLFLSACLAAFSELGCSNPKTPATAPVAAIEIESASLLPQRSDGKTPQRFKPGHVGAFEIVAESKNAAAAGARFEVGPVALRDSVYSASAESESTLARGQARRREVSLLLPSRRTPPRYIGPGRNLEARIGVSAEGLNAAAADLTLLPMPNHQFHLVVLSSRGEAYRFWERLPAMETFTGGESGDAVESRFYLVQIAAKDQLPPLPSGALGWSSIAAAVWDDYSPDLLSPPQRLAMLDWLHWGGRLIVSGPDSLDALRTSFLAEVLPAERTASAVLSADELDPVRDAWVDYSLYNGPFNKILDNLDQLKPAKFPEKAPEAERRDWAVDALVPRPGSRVLVSATTKEGVKRPLVVERAVGKGCVVQTAFRLRQPEFRAWLAEDDSLLNSALLRHYPRVFRGDREKLEIDFQWVGGLSPLAPIGFATQYAFARDCAAQHRLPSYLAEGMRPERPDPPTAPELLETTPRSSPPIGVWDDYNAVAEGARTALVEASRVQPPPRTRLLEVVGLYLLALVPLNWLVFRLLGKVEYAWWCMPAVTVLGCYLAWQATRGSLGLDRPQVELQIVECHDGYARGRRTRFCSIYASLATRFHVSVDDPYAQFSPFPTKNPPDLWFGRTPFVLREEKGKLAAPSFWVQSNSMGTLHGEQTSDLGGAVRLELSDEQRRSLPLLPTGGSVVNGTAWTLRDARLAVDLPDPKKYGIVPLGDLAPKQTLEIPWDRLEVRDRPAPAATPAAPSGGTPVVQTLQQGGAPSPAGPDPFPWDERHRTDAGAADAAEAESEGDANPADRAAGVLRRLRRLAEEARPSGNWRLTAWSTEEIDPLVAEPAAAQRKQWNLFVVHLTQAPRPVGPDPHSRRTAMREASMLEQWQKLRDSVMGDGAAP